MFSILPRPFQHSGPPCLQHPYFLDVVTQMVDVVTNPAQTTPTHYAPLGNFCILLSEIVSGAFLGTCSL